MQSIKLTRQSPFSAQQMFELITDVDRYDEFIPYCTAARVRERSETEMLADLAIGYKMLRETYSSRIELGADAADRHRASGQRAVSAFVQSMGV